VNNNKYKTSIPKATLFKLDTDNIKFIQKINLNLLSPQKSYLKSVD